MQNMMKLCLVFIKTLKTMRVTVKYCFPQDLATPGAFDTDPSLVWEFYHYRREVMLSKEPNKVRNVSIDSKAKYIYAKYFCFIMAARLCTLVSVQIVECSMCVFTCMHTQCTLMCMQICLHECLEEGERLFGK